MFGKNGYSDSYTYAEKRLFFSYLFFSILIIITALIPYINTEFTNPENSFNKNFVPLINIIFLMIPFIFTYSIESIYKIRAIKNEVEGFEKTKQFLLEENEIKQFSVICASTIVCIYFFIMFFFAPHSITNLQLFLLLAVYSVIVVFTPISFKIIFNIIRIFFISVIDFLKMLTPNKFINFNIYLSENKKNIKSAIFVVFISVIICILSML